MTGRDLLKRISAVMLAFVMTMSMSGFVFECLAEDELAEAAAGDANSKEAVSETGGEEQSSSETAEAETNAEAGAEADTGQTTDAEAPAGETEVTEPDVNEPAGDAAETAETVEVPEEQAEPEPEPEEEPEEELPEIPDSVVFRAKPLGSRSIAPAICTLNGKDMELRSLAGEPHAGNAVVQGGCTDGAYVYYLMVSSKTQKGRVLKLRLRDNKVVKVSAVLDIHHGNGMAYDAKRKLLVVSSRDDRKQELTMIDTKTLKITRQANVKYTYFKGATTGLTAARQKDGLAAVAYNSYYDCYVCLERTTHDLIVFNPDTLQAIAYVQTKIAAKYPGVYQAMDMDDQYVYLLLSSDGNTQKKNVILALDWNSENMKPIRDGKVGYITKPWKCNNDKTGAPDAAIVLKTPYEAENIFHVADKEGKSHFYMAEYDKSPVYKWVKKKVKYKVKWKKVKKKVKWKRVKRKGKWKWKYKTKRVWKYKTKYKWVTVKEINYCNRYNYVYDLGVF